MSDLRWAEDAPADLRDAADRIPAAEGEGRVVQDLDGRIVAADGPALRLLHHSWDTLTGVSSLDPRWHSCAADGREIPGEQHPAMVTLATGEPVRGFVMGIEAPSEDGDATFVWLEIDSDPLRDPGGSLLASLARFRDVSDLPVGRRATQKVLRSYRQAAHEASAQGTRFRAMVESSSDVIVEAGDGGRTTWVSPSLQDVLGWTPSQVLGKPLADLVDERDRGITTERVGRLISEGTVSGREEVRLLTADGSSLWMSAAWHRLTDGDEVYGVLVAFRDVHADVERREALAHMAHHDGLTGLLNRDSAYAWMRSQLRQAQEAGRHLGVLYLDVDFFKEVNDLHGHGVGDQVLAAVADRLRAAVREDDMVARAGGDEFVVGLRVVPDEVAVERRAEAVLAAVREIEVDQAGDVTVSIGLAVDDGSSDVDSIVQRADDALYRAKRAGRNRFSW